MERKATVKQVLDRKGYGYWAISPDATAYHALEMMADKDIGALAVLDDGRLVGVFSERDYARKVILKGKSSRTTSVGDLMSRKPVCVGPAHTIGECMVLMTKHHIRHLPVVQDDAILGVLSIGDVVKAIISEQEETINQLESYISGDEYVRSAPVG